MHPQTPVVVAARRTPIAGAGRRLAGLDVVGLAAPVLAALATELAELTDGRADGQGQRAQVDDVLLGNCCGPGGDVARQAALAAELGLHVPGVTVDRQCGSGLEAIRLGAALIRSGEAEMVLAGGAESASTAREGGRQVAFTPPGFADPQMGVAAQQVADRHGVSRERQDAYAARSHALAVAAQRAGVFHPELVAIKDVVDDERPRRGLTAEVLARFHPAFGPRDSKPGGSVTAGNSCGINDGAAAVAIITEGARARHRLPGLAVVASAVVGVDPALPGVASVPAVHRLLHRAGVELSEIDVIEITEAFAAQVLACTDLLGLHPLDPRSPDSKRVCPQGGAIALGHPWGASGALLVVRLFSTLVRGRGAPTAGYGIATCPIGGGQGIAMLFRRVG